MDDFEISDFQLRSHALLMRANVIETGNHNFSAKDAAERNKHLGRADQIAIKALDESQMKLVLRLKDLSRQELEEESRQSMSASVKSPAKSKRSF